MVEERLEFLVGLDAGRFVSGRHCCTTYIENLTFLYTSCLACIESVDLNALAKYSATDPRGGQQGKTFCLEKRQVNAKACGVRVTRWK